MLPHSALAARPRPFPSLAAALFALLLAVFAAGAPSAGFAQAPSISATLDDGVPAGTYKQNGDTLTYTTVITNSGDADATGVTLTEPTPADTTLVPGSVHASPVANPDAYTAVGNTKLYVGVAAPVGEPALESRPGRRCSPMTRTSPTRPALSLIQARPTARSP